MPYVDPGLGSMILQVVAAGAVAVLVTVSKIREATVTFFRRLFRR